MVMSLTSLGCNGHTLSEHWVNMLGMTAIVVGIITAIMVGMITDRIRRNIKIIILALLTGGILTEVFKSRKVWKIIFRGNL